MAGPIRRASFAAWLAVAVAGGSAQAQDLPRLTAASLTLPVLNPIVVNIMKERGFDRKHGFELVVKTLPSISAFYASLATGEVETLIGGPTVLQKLRLEGVPVKIIGTGLKLSDLVIFAKAPGIRSLADLRGRQLAADMGSQQYQTVSIYARSKGLTLGTDITVVNANFALARSQLAADRVDAAMVIEPIATMMLQENPQLRIIYSGGEAWKELTGRDGWELVTAMREEAIQRLPDGPKRLLAALQDVAAFVSSDPDAADRIAAETVKLPRGVLKAAVMNRRWELEFVPAASERAAIWDMFERAVAAGFLPKLPDEAIIHAP